LCQAKKKRERQANRAALQILPLSIEETEEESDDGVENNADEEPAAIGDPFLQPPSTAPATLQASTTLSAPPAQ